MAEINRAIPGRPIDWRPIRCIFIFTLALKSTRLGAELQQLYAEDKFAEILAHLAEKMLEMNKQKQQEIRGFLGWMEGYVGAKVEDLTPNTKLQGYYEHDYESFLVVLKKNRKKLAIDPVRREPGEVLKTEFKGSMGKLGPLLERIEKTDRLIDGCAAVWAQGRADQDSGG